MELRSGDANCNGDVLQGPGRLLLTPNHCPVIVQPVITCHASFCPLELPSMRQCHLAALDMQPLEGEDRVVLAHLGFRPDRLL